MSIGCFASELLDSVEPVVFHAPKLEIRKTKSFLSLSRPRPKPSRQCDADFELVSHNG